MKSAVLHYLLLAIMICACSNGYTEALTLLDAIKSGDWAIAQKMIRDGADVSVTESDGATALHWSVYRDNLKTTKMLLSGGAAVDATNDFGVMPLSLACTNGNAEITRTLLEHGADSNAALMTGETPLMTASRTGIVDAVAVLLEHGADVNWNEPEKNQTALMWAVSEQHSNVACLLVASGADIHAATKGGYTPLLLAVREGDIESTRLLLNAGADANTRAEDKNTALHVATLRGETEIVGLLLDRGADANANDPGFTALHWAAGTWDTELSGPNGITLPKDHEWIKIRGVHEGKLAMVRDLLEHGADPNARMEKNPKRYGFTYRSKRPKGATPFFLAAMAGDTDVMRLLVEHGAEPLARADDGMTPLIIATGVRKRIAENNVSEEDALAAVKLAVELGADVNAADEEGDTPLHGAARLKSVKMVQYLVDQGAEVNVVNARGQSPLYVADRHWSPGIDTGYDSPSEAGDLLRKLTPPDILLEAAEEWAIIPAYVRDSIEELLRGALDNPELRKSRDGNPIGPIFDAEKDS